MKQREPRCVKWGWVSLQQTILGKMQGSEEVLVNYGPLFEVTHDRLEMDSVSVQYKILESQSMAGVLISVLLVEATRCALEVKDFVVEIGSKAVVVC